MKRLFILLVTMTACVAAWAAEGYAVYTPGNTTLTFYYGDKPAGAYSLNTSSYIPKWYEDHTNVNVTRVVFDPSFAQARPTSTYFWFDEMDKLTTITGLNYLNTSEVNNMSGMFRKCNSLTSLDLSNFNTSKVTDMSAMFIKCTELTTLDLSSFNTENVTNMNCMFEDCSSLVSLNVGSFNTSKVTDMYCLFNACKNLENLNLSSFNTSKVENMGMMFYLCAKLNSLDLSSFNTSSVDNMNQMFANCVNLTNLNLSSFNTSKVTHMDDMFYNCSKLVTLDLSSFNTSKVERMTNMFQKCSNLKTIIAGNWSTASLLNSYYMFEGCTSLVGGAGTTYSSSHTDASYAHVDGGPSNPGYFTGEVYDLWINDIQVAGGNCNDLSGITGVSGTMKYDASSKTLTLDNARLTCGAVLNKACIRSDIDGLTISLKGTNSILVMPNASDVVGMVLANTTITGGDTLAIQGRRVGIAIKGGKTVTINNVHNLVVKGTNGIYSSTPSNTKLIVKGGGTNVLATGSQGAIRGMGDLELEDGLSFIEPEGGYFSNAAMYDASGNVATRVVIGNNLRGDVNGDGAVNVSDVTTLVNMILFVIPKDMTRGDVDGNSIVNVSDVTALVNIILKQ